MKVNIKVKKESIQLRDGINRRKLSLQAAFDTWYRVYDLVVVVPDKSVAQ